MSVLEQSESRVARRLLSYVNVEMPNVEFPGQGDECLFESPHHEHGLKQLTQLVFA